MTEPDFDVTDDQHSIIWHIIYIVAFCRDMNSYEIKLVLIFKISRTISKKLLESKRGKIIHILKIIHSFH